MVTANIALAHLLSVVLSYGSLVFLLLFVMGDDRFGRLAFCLSIPILGLGILITEYALPVVLVMVIFFRSYARRAPDPETRVRAWHAIFFSTLTAGDRCDRDTAYHHGVSSQMWEEVSPEKGRGYTEGWP
jgi:hypothetical protein